MRYFYLFSALFLTGLLIAAVLSVSSVCTDLSASDVNDRSPFYYRSRFTKEHPNKVFIKRFIRYLIVYAILVIIVVWHNWERIFR